ncbi:Gag-Pol polyprotein [Plakobranchus ocellatus]|uniref:Gag-Pol polyprotein n=1 Tax=Plakobranchus ocellatus TaxID=259542 RepID=A0AAV4BN49_9GAST|nr:Gag-Pol polyprotein [Plakobranchus ocellatus]
MNCQYHTLPLAQEPFAAVTLGLDHNLALGFSDTWPLAALLTIIDRNTRWPQAIPLPNITTAECIQALVRGWISRFGIPEDLSSDHGSQFTPPLWTEIAKRLGVKVHRTTAFHPRPTEWLKGFTACSRLGI